MKDKRLRLFTLTLTQGDFGLLILDNELFCETGDEITQSHLYGMAMRLAQSFSEPLYVLHWDESDLITYDVDLAGIYDDHSGFSCRQLIGLANSAKPQFELDSNCSPREKPLTNSGRELLSRLRESPDIIFAIGFLKEDARRMISARGYTPTPNAIALLRDDLIQFFGDDATDEGLLEALITGLISHEKLLPAG